MSKGEEKIASLLRRAGIEFEREKTFSNLKHGLFRFDFFLPNVEGGKCIIEFNGEQHYHFVSKFYKTQVEWRKAKEHDRRKISYCLANNIRIYVIPFWEIEGISNAADLFSDRFLAKTRWKNDEDAARSPLDSKK